MNRLEFKNEGKNIELKIYGEIGDYYWKEEGDDTITSVEELNNALKENKDASTIDIYINSNGGSVFDGVAIYNMLKRHRAYKRVFIDGFACSVASVIAMAGNSIYMPKTSMMMIHNAWTVAMGNSIELRKVADDLDKINDVIKQAYLEKAKIKEEELNRLMDEESFLTAEECFEYGFCTKLGDETEESRTSVENALAEHESLYLNKLQTLNSLKNAIRSIDEIDETETETEIAEVETEEAQPVNETEVVIEEEVELVVEEVKDNALKRFFNKEN